MIFRYIRSSLIYQAKETAITTTIANIVWDKYVTGNVTESPLKNTANSKRALRNPSASDYIFSGTNFANTARDGIWNVPFDIK